MTVCFFAPVTDREILHRVQFYAQDLAALDSGDRTVVVATRWSEIPWDADVYYVWWWTWAFLPLIKALLVGRPVVITGAFDYRWPEPGLDYVNRRPWERMLMRFALVAADANLFISEAEQRSVVEHLAVTRPSMAMPGVDTDHYVPLPGVTRDRRVFTLAWLELDNARRKGIFEIVRAVPLVLARVPDARFVIAGVQGTGYPALRQLASDLGVSHAIDWPGRLDEDAKLEAMQRCGVYLQPSVYEGFGLALAEAMSCGAAVVSSPNGAVPEVVGDAGLLVAARDPQQIADAVATILGDPVLQARLGEQARARAVTRFPLERRMAAVRTLVEAVARAPRAASRRLRARTIGRVMPWVAEASDAGLLYLLLSYGAVQGLTYAAQLMVAWMLSPADFGVVRTVEAVLNVTLLLGAAGMPSLAVRTVADIPDAGRRGAVLTRLAILAAAGGLSVAALVMVAAPRIVPAEALPYLRELALVVVLMAVSRTILNYFQGVQQIRDLARWQMALSAIALTAMAGFVATRGLGGWVVGRYVGEACALGGALFAVRHVLRRPVGLPEHLGAGRLAQLGMFIATSLVLRTALDHAGLLALGWSGQAIEDVGRFGLATLVSTMALLLPGALVQVYLPRLVKSRTEADDGAGALGMRAIALSGVLAVLLAAFGVVWARLIGGAYQQAGTLLQVLALVLPVKTLGLTCGARLLVCDRNVVSAVANAVVLALAVVALPLVASRYGPLGVAWATVGLETLLGVSLWKLSQRYWTTGPLARV